MHRTDPLLHLAATVCFILSLPAGSARGQVFDVDSTADAVDANPGDGVCASAAGECTLRAAVMEANASPYAYADIRLSAGTYRLTITGRRR